MRDYMSIAGYSGREDEIKNALRKFGDELDNFAKKLNGETAIEILSKAGEIYLAEEKRILSQKYPNSMLLSLLTIWVQDSKYGKMVIVGYPKIAVETFPETLVIEFGRPACETAGIHSAKKDSLGRKIGYVSPHSHIRTAIFNKKEEVRNEIVRLVIEEMEKNLGGK